MLQTVKYRLTGEILNSPRYEMYTAILESETTTAKEIRRQLTGSKLQGTDLYIVGVELFCITRIASGMPMGLAVSTNLPTGLTNPTPNQENN